MSHLPPHHQQFRQQQQQQQLAAASGAAGGPMSPTSAAQLSASAAHFHNQLAASQLASHQLHQIPHHLLSGHNQFGANPHAHLFAPNHPLSHPLSLNLNLAQANGMMAAAGGMPTSAQNNTNTTTTSGSESTSASSTPNSNQHNGGGGGSNNTSFLIKDILRYDGQKRKQRKARTAFSDHQLKELEASFEAKKYLTVQDRVELAARLKLSDTQVKTWYQNRRTKHKRQTAVGLELLSEAGHLMAYQSVLESSGSWLMKHYANTTNTQINMAAALLAAQAQAQAQAQAAQLAHVASSGAAGHQLHHHHHQHQANMLAAAAAAAAAAQSASSQSDDNNKQHLQHQHQNLQHQHQQQNRDSPSPATSTPPASKNDSLSSSSSGNANASANARATLSSPTTPPSRAQTNMSFAGNMNMNNLISQTTASGTPPHQRQSPHTSRELAREQAR